MTTSDNIVTVAPKTDISPRALSLARTVDRLRPGTYQLEIIIPEIRASAWQVEVVRTEHLFSKVLPKYNPE
jgi:hypothetical protein